MSLQKYRKINSNGGNLLNFCEIILLKLTNKICLVKIFSYIVDNQKQKNLLKLLTKGKSYCIFAT